MELIIKFHQVKESLTLVTLVVSNESNGMQTTKCSFLGRTGDNALDFIGKESKRNVNIIIVILTSVMKINHAITDIELLEVLTDVDDNIRFAKKVIENSDIGDSVRLKLCQALRHIKQRRNDPELHLAVIGEFSSGKTTFINALLRDELLKTSRQPTTAVATRLLHAKDLEVKVRFKSPQKRTVNFNSKTKRITLTWLPGVDDIDIRQFIHAVTSEDKVTKHVLDVTITHPALADGITIIDTPGTNPGINSKEHRAITRQVVENEADAAVIIVPAHNALSETLISFLANTLHPYLHRCVFVVTHMDEIRQRHQSSLIEYIRERITTELDIDQPTILTAAPQILIDDLKEEDISPRLQQWKDEFLKLESALWSRLSRERVLSIRENMLRLLTRLFEELSVSLQERWKHYKTKQEALTSEVIQNLDSFVSEQYEVCHSRLKKAISKAERKIESSIAKRREKTISKIRNAIFDANDWEELEKAVQDRAEEILKDAQKSLQKKLQRELENLSDAAVEVGQHFDLQFSEAYHRLQTIGGQIEADSELTNGSWRLETSKVFDSTRSLYQELDDGDNSLMGGGAVAGAVIGTSIMPVVGTAIGAFVGFLATALFMSLDQRKERIWDKLRPSLREHFDTVEKQAQRGVQDYGQNLKDALIQRLNSYISRYKALVDRMLSEQKAQLQRLNHLQQNVQADLSEINYRREALVTQQQRLAKVRVEK